MKKVLLLRYGEIFLKGKNKGQFEKALVLNIKKALNEFEFILSKTQGRYIISDYDETLEQKIVDKLLKVCGLFSLSRAVEIDTDYSEISKIAIDFMKNVKGSFKVSCNRADKTFPLNSMQVSADVGGDILESCENLFVDVHEPQHILFIDIRENKKTYVFLNVLTCIGGMPVGTSGFGLLLLSGGIDSPVAGFRMVKRGMKLACIHFESFPHTSRQAEDKALELASKLAEYNFETRVFIASVAEIQDAIHNNCDEEYMITLVRRFMLRIAERICNDNRIQCVITGESLGQVASQTIESMSVIGQVCSFPLLKPLVAYDKNETVQIAQKIGTYDISIRPFDDCCTVYLPDNPVIKPRLEKVLREESKLDVNSLIENAIKNIRVVDMK